MPSLLKTLLPLALLASPALSWTTAAYATFCNDDNCSESCGQPVATDNPGCLTQVGRHSVKFHGLYHPTVSLIASPGLTCDCQNYCEADIVSNTMWETRDGYSYEGDGCFKLRDEPAMSFRFVSGLCPSDQC